MRAPPTIRGGITVRLAVLVTGLFVFAAGIVAMLESRLALSPWDVLHQGLSRQTALSFGAANIVVGVVVIGAAWRLGAKIGIGTLANAALVGLFVEALSSLGPVASLGDESLPVRAALLGGGIALMGIGTGLYIGADLGAGPRDSLMLVGARRTPFRIGAVRAAVEASALAVGWALGGSVGVGTVAFALAIGPTVEVSFRLLELSPLRAAPRGHGQGCVRREALERA